MDQMFLNLLTSSLSIFHIMNHAYCTKSKNSLSSPRRYRFFSSFYFPFTYVMAFEENVL